MLSSLTIISAKHKESRKLVVASRYVSLIRFSIQKTPDLEVAPDLGAFPITSLTSSSRPSDARDNSIALLSPFLLGKLMRRNAH